MPRRLIADGNTGRVAIQYGNSRRAFEDPVGRLDELHFHSDLDYLRVEQQLDVTLSFPSVARATKQVDDGKKKGSSTYPALKTGTRDYSVATVYGSTDAPLVAFLDDTQLGASTVVQYLNGGKASRTLSAAIIGGNLTVRETYISYGSDLPAWSGRIRFLKFSQLIGPDPENPYTLQIRPDRVIASQGKLDSRNRYVRRVSNPRFVLFVGRTMDTKSAGFIQARTDGTTISSGYSGSFSPGETRGVDV